jgi:hypothetical protein
MRYAAMLCVVLTMLSSLVPESNAFYNSRFPTSGGLELYIDYDAIYSLLNGHFFKLHGFEYM